MKKIDVWSYIGSCHYTECVNYCNEFDFMSV